MAAKRGPFPYAPSTRIVRFFRKHLIHGKGQFAGRPFEMEPWQRECVEGIYDRLRPNGLRVVNEALLGVPKKNGKTHLAAGLGAAGVFSDGHFDWDGGEWTWVPEYGAEVYNMAGSREQARVLFAIARGFVEKDPVLSAMSRVYRDAIEVPETESVWRVMAADARLAHGPNPSMAIIDEIWTHRDPELYEAFASAGAARRQPLLLTITTAGWDVDSIAYSLMQRGRDSEDPAFFFRWWQAEEGSAIDDRKAWRLANPSRWVTIRYLEAEMKRARKLGLEGQFRRWHLNQWSSAEDAAIPLPLWDACSARPSIPPGSRVMLGVDAAPRRDSTAIAVVRLDDDDVFHSRVEIMHADRETGYLDFDALEQYLRSACETWAVERILCDPAYLIRSMLMLREEGYPIETYPQRTDVMVKASQHLFEVLVEGRLRHGGNRELRQQAQNAGRSMSSYGWRFHKMRSSGVIDGIIALTVAAFELQRAEDRDEGKKPVLFV